MPTCSVEGCKKQVASRGMCNAHYRKWVRYGDPLTVKKATTFGLSPEARFWSKVDRSGDGCWEWQGWRNNRNYGQFGMDRGGPRFSTVGAHRAAWEFTHGPIPDGLFVCHCCDNPPCCRPEHLFLGTPADNMHDRDAKGRGNGIEKHPEIPRPKGEAHLRAKLTDEGVRSIRRRYTAGGITQQALADEYGITQARISCVIRRETWRHIM